MTLNLVEGPRPHEPPARRVAMGIMAGVGAVGLAVGALAAGPVFLLTLAAEGLHDHLMAKILPEIYEPAVEYGTRDLRDRVGELEETVRELRERLDGQTWAPSPRSSQGKERKVLA